MPRKSANRAQKECPPGKVVNPLTGRCVNPCLPGTVRNPDTGRCVKEGAKPRRKSVSKKSPKRKSASTKSKKSPKRKDCPPGKVVNPLTKRCIFPPIRDITIRPIIGQSQGKPYVFSIDRKDKKTKVNDMIVKFAKHLDTHPSLLTLLYMKDEDAHIVTSDQLISDIPYSELFYGLRDRPECPPGLIWSNRTGGCDDREIVVKQIIRGGEDVLHTFIISIPNDAHFHFTRALEIEIRKKMNVSSLNTIEDTRMGLFDNSDPIIISYDRTGTLCFLILPINPFKFVGNRFSDENVYRHVGVTPETIRKNPNDYYIIMTVQIRSVLYNRWSGYSPTITRRTETVVFRDTDEFPQNYREFVNRGWSYKLDDGNWDGTSTEYYSILSFERKKFQQKKK
jgi:hypothetical protein